MWSCRNRIGLGESLKIGGQLEFSKRDATCDIALDQNGATSLALLWSDLESSSGAEQFLIHTRPGWRCSEGTGISLRLLVRVLPPSPSDNIPLSPSHHHHQLRCFSVARRHASSQLPEIAQWPPPQGVTYITQEREQLPTGCQGSLGFLPVPQPWILFTANQHHLGPPTLGWQERRVKPA